MNVWKSYISANNIAEGFCTNECLRLGAECPGEHGAPRNRRAFNNHGSLGLTLCDEPRRQAPFFRHDASCCLGEQSTNFKGGLTWLHWHQHGNCTWCGWGPSTCSLRSNQSHRGGRRTGGEMLTKRSTAGATAAAESFTAERTLHRERNCASA